MWPGFLTQQDTVIIPLLHSVLKDDKVWETPSSFNPQHFLDEKGNFKKNPAFLPFSAGNYASAHKLALFWGLVCWSSSPWHNWCLCSQESELVLESPWLAWRYSSSWSHFCSISPWPALEDQTVWTSLPSTAALLTCLANARSLQQRGADITAVSMNT